ncbi:nucleotidyltransferase domain-containing protein [bacterium]|nr:nucleotidyltransferase domain-containing protein [bacterium]
MIETAALRRQRKSAIDEEIKRMLATLIKMRSVTKVILFGSAAKEETGIASDIDIIVVMKTEKRFIDRLDELYTAVQPEIGTDILAYTPDEFEALASESAFVKHAVREGKVIYDRCAP